MTPEALAYIHALAFSSTRAWSAAEFRDLLDQRGMILTGDDRAFALLRVTLDEAEVLTIATAPEHRRKGLARAVLAQAETAVQALGAAVIFLEVAEDNDAARALYAQAGYAQIGRRPGYYLPKDAAPVAALVLRKALVAQ
ncbi:MULTISPECIES: GNAT family N-acetyltransferase [Yoonia]|uniref:Ribosomal-protein-alanine acetyltransferase, putative n=1 Tax=Yoonia vestfoldensis SKA53 TaxID=314232 RepID=A3V586_9RHOB|nr:GNAT family N-acetyltransferase [Yoonia vestfoldensis]EAQ06804.1 ribosomal-protein-alanine acetyltransferase, putative [Yoonia vestfoldensis SKA53]